MSKLTKSNCRVGRFIADRILTTRILGLSRPQAPLIETVHLLLFVKRKIILQDIILAYSAIMSTICYVQSGCYSWWNDFEIVHLILLLYAHMNADAEESKFKLKLKNKGKKVYCVRVWFNEAIILFLLCLDSVYTALSRVMRIYNHELRERI